MLEYLKYILLLNYIFPIWGVEDELNTKVITIKNLMVWPNATVPFYVNPDHFDQEQTVAIMTALSIFAFKTCLKFAPVMDRPKDSQHVMFFVNPEGIRRCKIETTGHSVYEPHMVLLGYDCLQSPQIDMMIMRALGFPFEHNRLSRDLYIDVLIENIEPGAIELFTKDIGLPVELRAQPYDVNSVMHFGQRDYSKNGHRTILFKSPTVLQNRVGLSATDLKKIELVYGPECQTRDRQEKLELCQSYPGVARRKRDATGKSEQPESLRSLRVNPNITPPAAIKENTTFSSKELQRAHSDETEGPDKETVVSEILKELNIEDQAQEIIDQVYKISSQALKNAREKYCNNTDILPIVFNKTEISSSSDILGILQVVADYARNMVEHAVANLTIFCQNPDSISQYQRQKCNWKFDSRCLPSYKSTKSGPVRHSTNHRPHIYQSTIHKGQAASYSYDKFAWRSGNESVTLETTTAQIQSRRKREASEAKKTSVSKVKLQKEKDKIATKGNVTKESGAVVKKRFFESRRYKARKQENKSEVEWAGSYISEELNKDVSPQSIEKELREVNDSPFGPPPDKVKVKEPKKKEVKFLGDKDEEVLIAGENEAKEDDKDESDIETTTIKEKKYSHKSKAKEKIKIKDTFELFEDKKKLKEEREKEKKGKDDKKYKKRTHNELPLTVAMTRLNREFYNERRWPEGIVRYVITPLKGYDIDDMRSRLQEVARLLKKKTCVKLEEVTPEEADNFEDYLVLDDSPDFVTGRVGGKQHFGCIELFKGNQHRQHTAMMVMAMLGFYFEVSRHDRDKHIRVHMRHVRPDKLHHFEKIRDEATLDLPYDYESAMHPAWQFWRKIGKTGISTVATYKQQDPDGSVMRKLGQNEKLLSDSDLIKINTVYGVECFTDMEMRASNHEKRTS